MRVKEKKFVMWGIVQGILVLAVCVGLGFFVPACGVEETPGGGEGIDGTYVLSLPMPGGAKESTLVLSSRGGGLSGTMSAPGNPSEIADIRDGTCEDGKFRFSADIGRITYTLEGSFSDGRLAFDMTTVESIPLGDGQRLAGKTGEISGSYQVPVYSPGGVKENRFDLVAEGGVITGEMYSLGDDGPPGGMDGGPGQMPAPQGGGPAQMPATQATGPTMQPDTPPENAGPEASADGKRDLNSFYDGSYEKNNISLYTKTAQGSLFHFTGRVEGDAIKLTLQVTDSRTGLEAEAVASKQ